jgi:two-component system NtrC family sensor kinase
MEKKKIVQNKIEETKERHQIVADTIEKIAHQWRQPLNTVSLLLQELYFKLNLGTLYSGKENEEELKELFTEQYNDLYDKVNLHLQYLSETVDDFRKAVASQDVQEREYFRLQDFITDLEDFVDISLKKEKIQLNRVDNLDELGLIEINGIKNELKQVMLNIIHNAQDIFRERKIENRQLDIGAFVSKTGKVVITVRDNAGGIEDDVIGKIFDPYFTTRHETRGTGLGLYMSKEMISKSFGGNLDVRNSAKCLSCESKCSNEERHHGACFLIELPDYRIIE